MNDLGLRLLCIATMQAQDQHTLLAPRLQQPRWSMRPRLEISGYCCPLRVLRLNFGCAKPVDELARRSHGRPAHALQICTFRVQSIRARAKSSRFCTSAHCLFGGSLTRGFSSRLDAPF